MTTTISATVTTSMSTSMTTAASARETATLMAATREAAATRELARVVRPGGVVALTAWVSESTTHIVLIREAFQVAGLPEPRRRRPAEVEFERTVGGLTALAHQSGLEPVKSRELTWDWTISWDDLWTGLVASMGQPYQALNVPAQERVREQLQQRTRALEANGQIHVPSVAAYILA